MRSRKKCIYMLQAEYAKQKTFIIFIKKTNFESESNFKT